MVWQKRFMLFRALIATALAMAALDVAMRHGSKGVGGVSLVILLVFLYWILVWAVYTLFAVTCHRIVLLGETSVPKYGLLSWTSRETRFFGWLFVLFFYALLIVGPVLLVTFGAVFLGVPFFKGYEKYWFFLGAVGLYTFSRGWLCCFLRRQLENVAIRTGRLPRQRRMGGALLPLHASRARCPTVYTRCLWTITCSQTSS